MIEIEPGNFPERALEGQWGPALLMMLKILKIGTEFGGVQQDVSVSVAPHTQSSRYLRSFGQRRYK